MDTNISPTLSLFLAILVSMMIVLAFAWISLKLTTHYKLLDVPGAKPHKRHKFPTPLAGGIALMATLFLSELLLGLITNWVVRASLFAALPVFLFGLWDDIKDIHVSTKLIGQLLSALILIHLGIYIRVFESPDFFLQVDQNIKVLMDWIITIFWIVGITNAFNFVDSKDGLAVGLGGITAAFFVLMTLDSNQIILSQHSAVILGASIGLYFFNSPPAKLFLGDSGSQTLGFLLAALAITYNPQGAYQLSTWFVPILLLGVPIFDTTLVIISRTRRNQPVYKAALDHTYHRLLFLGVGSHRSVLIMHFTALILGCVAFIILNQTPIIANTVFLITMLLGAVTLLLLDSRKYWDKSQHAGSNTE